MLLQCTYDIVLFYTSYHDNQVIYQLKHPCVFALASPKIYGGTLRDVFNYIQIDLSLIQRVSPLNCPLTQVSLYYRDYS